VQSQVGSVASESIWNYLDSSSGRSELNPINMIVYNIDTKILR
jgi:hypothetical protein